MTWTIIEMSTHREIGKLRRGKNFPPWEVRESSMYKLSSLVVVVLVFWDHYATQGGLCPLSAGIIRVYHQYHHKGVPPVPPYPATMALKLKKSKSFLPGIMEKIIWWATFPASISVVRCHILQNLHLQRAKPYNSPQHPSGHCVQVLEAASVIKHRKYQSDFLWGVRPSSLSGHPESQGLDKVSANS